MQVDRLTETMIEGFRAAPDAKVPEYRWEAGTGFGVAIKPGGSIAYVAKIMVKPEAGEPFSRRVVIGPALGNRRVPLKEARRRADAMRLEGELGVDPSKRVAKQEASDTAAERAAAAAAEAETAKEQARAEITLGALFDVWRTEHCVKLRDGSDEAYRVIFDAHVRPRWGHLPAKSLTRAAVAVVHLDMADRPYSANAVIRTLRALLNWAAVEKGVQFPGGNPLEAFPLHDEEAADRFLRPIEIQTFWERLPDCDMDEGTRNALRLALLLGQRGIEIVTLRRQDLDLGGGIWTVPKAVAKNGRRTGKDHLVPLPPLARQVLADQLALVDGANAKREKRTGVAQVCPYLFPGSNGRGHMGRNALSKALLRNLPKFGFVTPGTEGSEPPVWNGFTPHDLRRTMASHVELLGHSSTVVGAVLNHVQARKGTVTGKHYTVAELLSLKRRALLDWEKAVRDVLAGRDPFAQSNDDRLAEEARVLGIDPAASNVVALRRTA